MKTSVRVSKREFNEYGVGRVLHIDIYMMDGDKYIGKAKLRMLNGSDVLEVSHTEVYDAYRQKGYGKELYMHIAHLWHTDEHMKGTTKFSRLFINPTARYLARWLVDSGYLPESTWDEDLIC